jgi:hypothetical protein
MSLRTFLGPLLGGTVKSVNPIIDTSATPSANYLTWSSTQTSWSGGYRNTGASDFYQSIAIPAATWTGLGTLSGTPIVSVPTYSVGGVAYPLVIPAGSLIDNIVVYITTAFTLSGTTPVASIALQLIGGVGSAYTTAQTIATLTLTGSGLPTVGYYTMSNSGTTASASLPLVATGSATPTAMLTNTGVTDSMFQLSVTGTGTTPAISAGACTISFDYILRNYDGTWYPQTPPGTPQSTFPQTY